MWLILAALLLFALDARALCTDTGLGQTLTVTSPDRSGADDMGEPEALGATSCDGCTAAGVSSWTLNFTCNGGDCTCGRYVNGDYWILDPNCDSETTANSVLFTSEVPNDRDCAGAVCNGLAKNPTSNLNTWDARASFYTVGGIGSLDVADYEANVVDTSNRAASFLKAISYRPGSATCGAGSCTGSNQVCIHSYFVVTVVCTAPSTDAFRPPYGYTEKPAESVGATPAWREATASPQYSYIPTFDMLSFTGTPAMTLQRVYEQMQMVQVDHWRVAGGSAQSVVGLLNSNGTADCSPSGVSISRTRSEGAMMLLDDSGFTTGSPNRRDLMRAWIQAGIDYYGTINGVGLGSDGNTEVRWYPAGGQGAGRKMPLVMAAYFLNDSNLRQLVRDIVADSYPASGNEDAWFNEDANAYWSTTAIGGARALYGEYCPEHNTQNVNGNSTCSHWWTSTDPEDCRDPDGYVDGGAQTEFLGGGYVYQFLGHNGMALVTWLMPQLRELWYYDPFWQLMDRWEGHPPAQFAGDGGNGGLWGTDNCTNTDPACTGGANNLCTAGTGRLCDATTCASQHGNAGNGGWGSAGYISAAIEDAYWDNGGDTDGLRDCGDGSADGNCAGYIGLTAGDSVSCTAWCEGAECPSCLGGGGALALSSNSCVVTEPTRPTHQTSWCGPSPLVSAAIEVTDDSPVELSNNPGHWAVPMARSGGQLFISYFADIIDNDGPPFTTPSDTIRNRVLDLATGTFTSANSSDTTMFAGTDPTNNDTDHHRPSLLRDNAGNVLVFVRDDDDTVCTTARACTRGGFVGSVVSTLLRSRFTNEGGAGLYDIGTLHDPTNNCAYVYGESANDLAWPWAVNDGSDPPAGLPRNFWRNCSGITTVAGYDGPYEVFEAQTGIIPTDTATFDFCGSGNIFNKGRIVLGVDNSSLHWLTGRNNTFNVCDLTASDARYIDCTACSPGVEADTCAGCRANLGDGDAQLVEWQADLYYARSVDHGRTWCNHAGTTCTSAVTRIDDATAAYRVYTGETRNNSEYSFDVGPLGDLYVALQEHDGDSNDLIAGRPDWALGSGVGTGHNLRLLRVSPNGVTTTTTIENQPGPVDSVRYILLAGAYGELFLMKELPLEWRRSVNHGVTWTEWQAVAGSSGSNDRAVQYYRDPFDRGLVHLSYTDLTNAANVLYRSVRLGR